MSDLSRAEKFRSVCKNISGKVMRAFPVHLENMPNHNKEMHRTPTIIAAVNQDALDFAESIESEIGAHAEINKELSSAFAFLLLACGDKKAYQMDISTDKTWSIISGNSVGSRARPARMEIKMKVDGDVAKVLHKAFESIKFKETNRSAVLMISFNGQAFPNSHKDDGPNKKHFRVLWDFHSRGRILSVPHKNIGVFLENCGLELCSLKMCGNESMLMKEVSEVKPTNKDGKKKKGEGHG